MAAQGDHSAFAAFARRILRAYGRRVSTADPADLEELVQLRAELEATIGATVAGLHANGYSWTQIGDALGVGRTAAHKRYAHLTRSS